MASIVKTISTMKHNGMTIATEERHNTLNGTASICVHVFTSWKNVDNINCYAWFDHEFHVFGYDDSPVEECFCESGAYEMAGRAFEKTIKYYLIDEMGAGEAAKRAVHEVEDEEAEAKRELEED